MKDFKTNLYHLTIAYVGNFFFTAWGIWSIHKYGIAFADLNGFIIYSVKSVTFWW